MRLLYHLFLSPFCRKVRVALAEKGLAFELKNENTAERREEFLRLNPACEVPVLVEPDGAVVCGAGPICEFLEEAFPETQRLLPGGPAERAEARRLVDWFDGKFNREVTANLVGEKLMKRLLRQGVPDTTAIRAGQANVRVHLDYIGWLVERRNWLAGEAFSLADIAAAAHLSTVDYLGDVPWDDHRPARDWYARIKSRRAFRAVLADHIPGVPPPKYYADPDF
jgi:glutathione S-transferase